MANAILVNSLKRLYEDKKVTKEDIVQRVKNGTITESDFKKITGDQYE